MIIQNVPPIGGRHCETSTLGVLVRHQGIELTEPMLFGLGAGLGFIYWDAKGMDIPFLGGRIKAPLITKNVTDRLGLALQVKETTSERKAWQNVAAELDKGHPVGLQLDCYHLDYFSTKIHFGGHFVAIYGYDDAHAYLIDTDQQGGALTTSLDSLRLARAERGPMTARNLSFTLAGSRTPELKEVIGPAIRANAHDFLNPPIANLGFKGIEKAAKQVLGWESRDPTALRQLAEIMERGGTGGALFRNLYRDFLGECAAILDDATLAAGHRMYGEIAEIWTEAIEHLAAAADDPTHLQNASGLLEELSRREHDAMRSLAEI